MELAHVVHRVSTDAEYAAQFQSDPETTAEKLGLKLSSDELASLLSILRRNSEHKLPGISSRPNAGKSANWY